MPKLSEFYISAEALAGQWHCVNWGERGPAETQDDPSKLYFLIGSTLAPGYADTRSGVLMDFGREATEHQIETACMARGILLGWKNYEDDAGQPVAYSVEEAARILDDPRNAVIREYVRGVGISTQRLRDAHLARLQGNSLPA